MTFGEVPGRDVVGCITDLRLLAATATGKLSFGGTLSTLFAGGLYRAAHLSYLAERGCVTLLP